MTVLYETKKRKATNLVGGKTDGRLQKAPPRVLARPSLRQTSMAVGFNFVTLESPSPARQPSRQHAKPSRGP